MSLHFFAGMATGLALIVAIGSQNAFVLRQGVRREHVLPIVVFCAVSDALLILAGVAGAGAFIRGNALLLDITRYGGAAFLGAYGSPAARRAWVGGQMRIEPTQGSTLGAALAACFGFTFLNPHVYLAHRGAAGLGGRAARRPRTLGVRQRRCAGQPAVVQRPGLWRTPLGTLVRERPCLARARQRDCPGNGCAVRGLVGGLIHAGVHCVVTQKIIHAVPRVAPPTTLKPRLCTTTAAGTTVGFLALGRLLSDRCHA